MARLLVPQDQSWYDELHAVSYYGESEHERSIKQHVESLFIDHHVFPFKKDVVSQTAAATKRPDLAMVRRDFTAWGIIEVEIAQHDLDHVLTQTRVFSSGRYNAPEMAEYIRAQLKEYCSKTVSVERLTKLLDAELPSVLVLADAHFDEWQVKLEKEGVGLCIFEVYKNTRGRLIYRTCGRYPAADTQEAHVRRHKSLPNVYEVVGNFEFRSGRAKVVEIAFDDRLTRWSPFDEGGKRYLRFVGKVNPLSPNKEYCVIADKANNYRFERS